MKQRVARASGLLILALMALVLSAGGASGAEWNNYQPGNGACWIKLPANPEYQTQQAEGMTVHVYIARDTQSPPSTYALSFGEFAKGKVPAEKDAAKTLDAERANFVKAVNGKLLNEKPLTLESHPGRELSVSADNDKTRYLVRAYLVGARIFHLVVWMPASRAESGAADASKFFDSFQLR